MATTDAISNPHPFKENRTEEARRTLLAVVACLTATVHSRLILYLPLNKTSGTQATDFSGNNRHARYINSPQLQGREGARLDGTDDYIQLPNDLMRNQYSISASIEVNIRSEQSGYYFIFGIGNTGSNGDGNGYIFATGDPELRAAVTPSNWEAEAEIRTTAPIPRNQWKTITFVIESAAGRIALYQDGMYLSGHTNNDNIVAPGSIGTGATSTNYIGRSTFRNDKYLAGSVRNFRLYDHALTASEVAGLQNTGGGGGGTNVEDRVTAALLLLNIPNLDAIRGNIKLPTNSNGVPVSWTSSDPNIISNTGRVNRPVEGDVTVILTARVSLDGAGGERSFFATVKQAGT
jgi:large repetitive protein